VELKNNKLLIGIILYLFSANIMISYSQQDKPLVSSGNIQFYLDKAVFSGKENKSYVEFYLMFFADQIGYKGINGELQMDASVTDNNGNSVIGNKRWTIDVTLPQKDALKTKVIYDQWNEYLIPGEYKIHMEVKDANNSRIKGVINGLINIPKLLSDNIHSSEIEFISSTGDNASLIQFQKGKRNVIPNPSRRFGIFNPALSVYYELYNIGAKGTLQINYSIIDKDNREVISEQSKMDKPGNTAAILKEIDISKIKSGVYDLHIKVTDSLSNNAILISRSFEIIQGDFISNIKSLSEEESHMYTTLLSYIATPSQLADFKKLNSTGKAGYLIQFWKSKNLTPDTPENEYLKNIQKRFVYAAKNFGWSSIRGWETDMGRICIKYGMPDEVQQFNSEASSRPYQIWIYKENREYHFVFGDLLDDGRFTLLDSDKEGEISNSQWRALLNKM
jgi:GWxTD domain-containing protein